MARYHSDRHRSTHSSASSDVGHPPPEKQAPRLLDQVRERLRRLGRAKRTEEAYVGWIRRFILANGKRHPDTMGAPQVEAFLTHLAASDNVAPSTQNQALAALLFLYREVLGRELPWMDEIQRAKRPRRLPTVLTEDEVSALLAQMEGCHGLMAALLYGTGMRLMECVRLRIKDVDFGRNEVVVRDGKGGKDRRTILPQSLRGPLLAQVEAARQVLRAIWSRVMARSGYRRHWHASIRTRRVRLAGSTCSRRRAAASIRAAARCAGIMWTRRGCSARSRRPAGRRDWRSRPVATRCGIPSPRTCWKPVTTSARCRSCSATRT